MQTLTALTGKGYTDWDVVTTADEGNLFQRRILITRSRRQSMLKKDKNGILFATLGVMGLLSLAGFSQRKKKSDR